MSRYDTLLNASAEAVRGKQLKFVKRGYGQVEPNHLSAQRTGQIYAQLPADGEIPVLEQGQFVKYDYANERVNFTGPGEWMLVYNEIKLYREGQNDCEFAMIKDNYNARIYSPYGEDLTEGRSLQSRYYAGYDERGPVEGKTITVKPAVAATYVKTEDLTLTNGKTYYTTDGETYTAVGSPDVANIDTYYEEKTPAIPAVTYTYDKVTVDPALDIYEMFGTDDPFHINPKYKEKRMPEGTKMVPRVFKTNVGDIYTTNTIDEETLEVGDTLKVGKADGILIKNEGADASLFESGDAMLWQVVKVYTMPDGQPGVKIMRIA